MTPLRRASPLALLLGSALVLAGCGADRQQSILNPQGARAEPVHGLWLLLLGIGVAVWLIVMVVLVVAVARRRAPVGDQGSDHDTHGGTDRAGPIDQTTEGEDGYGTQGEGPSWSSSRGNKRRTLWIVAIAGAIVPSVIITVVTVASTVVNRDIDPGLAADGTVIEVTGHQYWWEVRYPGQEVVTANEVHIPTGERVQLQVTANDVIHSFWVPTLSGKIDMIPGRSNTIWLEAADPGVYWGQCAEYCGQQHAKMRFVVVAHEPSEFSGWVATQQESALPPTVPEPPTDDDAAPLVAENDELARGREVFMSSSCVYCHAINGTAAAGEYGPDLAHLAGRQTLAAGILPNDRGNLAGWILDPQSIKPGVLMPGTDLDGDDLQALLTYLESLE